MKPPHISRTIVVLRLFFVIAIFLLSPCMCPLRALVPCHLSSPPHRYNCILVVDTVASLGAVPFFTDQWGIDVVYTGSQKAFSCPPGPSPITFNQRAMWVCACACSYMSTASAAIGDKEL